MLFITSSCVFLVSLIWLLNIYNKRRYWKRTIENIDKVRNNPYVMSFYAINEEAFQIAVKRAKSNFDKWCRTRTTVHKYVLACSTIFVVISLVLLVIGGGISKDILADYQDGVYQELSESGAISEQDNWNKRCEYVEWGSKYIWPPTWVADISNVPQF